jgi:hypothetical protein
MAGYNRRKMMGVSTREDRVDDQARHFALVESFRARLAGTKSPLDTVSTEQLERAREAFRELTEVAGEPVPAPVTWVDR